MLVGELVYNDTFYCNFDYEIYDYMDKENKNLLFTTKGNRMKPLDLILGMQIKYITLSDNTLIIYASK